MNPLVSVIIPCHNAAPWLGETIGSALVQTWPRTEVIVVDDGSSDNSLAIARTFEAQGVRVVDQANAGASAARNHGLRLAGGDFIQFLDADDLLEREKIARQMDVLAAAPAAIAAGPWGRFDRDPATAIFTPEDNWRDSEPVEWLALNFAGRGMMPPAAWLVPRALATAAGPWDERLTLNDDGEYFCRVMLKSTAVRFCAGARSFYRSNLPGSLSRRRSEAAWHSAFLSHERCVQEVLAREDSARTRRAGADLFQRLAYTIYPDCPELVADCESRARQLGGSTLRAEGGKAFQGLARIIGWKAARRAVRRLKPQPPR
jgi:glycosyltransferase involved in cell wall biosynthesis